MSCKPSEVCLISREADVYYARSLVRSVAQAAGASVRERAELEIVASELAWNILRHVGTGTLEVESWQESSGLPCLCIRVRDPGAPLDLPSVVQDGWSGNGPLTPEERVGRKGLGCGLGAVARLADDLEQRIIPGGKELVATRVLRDERRRLGRPVESSTRRGAVDAADVPPRIDPDNTGRR
ncbi:ATP-binding protein [Myxococcota bacterium]